MSTTAVSARTVVPGNNPQVAALPNHLLQFSIDQNHGEYTPVDHAVWRFIMRQAVHILRENAHRVYFKGLLDTGINLDRIPRIDEMNRILGKIGWGAVAVDGFIPPAAFMEFQAYRVLVIACDMRQINHIEYTPAPDIVHEAAGHAPIIVDLEYAGYLQRFGEVGAKAISSRKDIELYEAIRRLSILKEMRDPNPKEIKEAEADLLHRQANLGAPSEMARLSRLHWWTVEYGLIGSMSNPKIYGAGLLSSIGEAVSCLDEGVKKIPYSLAAADYAFDITTKQPQLFVTPDFDHLQSVLSQFVDTMAVSVGGKIGLDRAIECSGVCTVVYSSGLQVSGVVSEYLKDANGNPAYVGFTGRSALAVANHELAGQGKDYHSHGFSSPVGKLRGHATPLERMTDSELRSLGLISGERTKLVFESGIEVSGRFERFTRVDGKLVVITFTDCTVKRGSDILFQPSFGLYDMAIGEKIVSVFGGSADKDAYEQVAPVSKQRTVKAVYDDNAGKLHSIYRRIREIRDGDSPVSGLADIWRQLVSEHPDDWLAGAEIYEILAYRNLSPDLQSEIRASLEAKARDNKSISNLISDGLHLIDIRFEPPKHAD